MKYGVGIDISKRGNRYLRKTGYEIMESIKSSCSNNNELKYI